MCERVFAFFGRKLDDHDDVENDEKCRVTTCGYWNFVRFDLLSFGMGAKCG